MPMETGFSTMQSQLGLTVSSSLLDYQTALGDNPSLQPNLQFTLNPDEISQVPDFLAIGVQMTVLF